LALQAAENRRQVEHVPKPARLVPSLLHT
jgi:hypothetical protein